MEIFPAHFFPSIHYIKDWINAEDPVLDAYENFQKQSYRSRCYILSPQGKLPLIVPTQKNNASRKIQDIKLSYAENWQAEHLKTLQAAYHSSPFYEHYDHVFEDIYEQKFSFLFELNKYILERILKMLHFDSEVIVTDTYYSFDNKIIQADHREKYKAKQQTKLSNPYSQVFEENYGFTDDLSIIDVICNLGPETFIYLKKLS